MAVPKYLQQELDKLRQDNAVLTEENQGLRAKALGPEDSNTRVWGYSDPDINLPNGAAIIFELATGRRIRVRVDRSGMLDINGDTGLWVKPDASNSMRVTTHD